MTMEMPQTRLGSNGAWLELVQAGEDSWRVTADWCSSLSADYTASLTRKEAADFATRMLSHLRAPSGSRFSAAVTPGRNNPLVLSAEPVGDRFAFFVRLTPNGDDGVCHLQMEINPIDVAELRDIFHALYTSLVL
ncbi:hypothetical protein [Streptomyces sp. Ag109_O5-10]|uniref:hypothetical protein n=1 Tax=Streptomyces sp. Ag109_O5-10 TaxID=1855349 RepID=UPI00115FD9FC|nr:hypothetical protein [Streptomyces sp. Ag109_O5-10]